jgi:hypothetical protein
MHTTQSSILYAGAMFLGMVLLLELGWRLGRQHRGRSEESSRAGLGAVEGAVFALMGLLIAFTFSGAASRFDERRQLIVEESNAIGTAWLRLDPAFGRCPNGAPRVVPPVPGPATGRLRQDARCSRGHGRTGKCQRPAGGHLESGGRGLPGIAGAR